MCRRGRRRFVGEPFAELLALALEFLALGVGEGLEGEFLRLAALEQLTDPVDDGVMGRRAVGVGAELAARDVEAGLLLVAGHGGVAPFAVQLLAAEDVGPVDGSRPANGGR